MKIEQLIINAKKLNKQTQHVSAAAFLLGIENVDSLCVWCAEKIAQVDTHMAYRLPMGGECSNCTVIGRDVIVVSKKDEK